ncbi:MAG: cellulose 1,4-beta-cellobiosidase [Actinomycetota bacterium]|nr:cellulose 1,4-beta-cellobiosidase [Actinomycetota bacterium]
MRNRRSTRRTGTASALAALLATAALLAVPGAGPASAAPVSESTIVPDPSWTCGKPQGLPQPPPGAEPVLRLSLTVGTVHDVGVTQYGQRRVLDVTGGTVRGGRVRGTVLTGGLDLEMTLTGGSVELEELDMLRLDDGTLVYLRTCGVAPAGEETVRIVPDFEVATSGSYAWLGSGSFVGTRTVNLVARTIEIAVYDVSGVSSSANTVRLNDPAGVPNQNWECATGTGTRGASVFSESVSLGASLSVGATKRGTRNVIPITGGTTSGRVQGSVVPGGADYQLMGSGSARLDARYALSTRDGEYVLVRNCGPFGALVPTFETRAAGPYSFLNTGRFLSSDPQMASGGVGITF